MVVTSVTVLVVIFVAVIGATVCVMSLVLPTGFAWVVA